MKPLVETFLLCLGLAASSSSHADAPKSPAQERLAKAEAMFAERCKTAGEKIYRTADKVEGVFLMKLRPKEMNYGDQYRMDDPYGRDLGGEGYIESFVRGSFQATHRDIPVNSPHRLGYRYVETLDPQDGQRYRYTGAVREVTRVSSILIGGDGKPFKTTAFVLDKTPATGPQPRFGVTYDDISTREERDYWIAGSSLKVIDLKTHEVMAERIGYMMDRGQGSNTGGRSPWLLAADNACPAFWHTHGAQTQPYQTFDFVESVLKPIREK